MVARLDYDGINSVLAVAGPFGTKFHFVFAYYFPIRFGFGSFDGLVVGYLDDLPRHRTAKIGSFYSNSDRYHLMVGRPENSGYSLERLDERWSAIGNSDGSRA